jgi:hypothetical protein
VPDDAVKEEAAEAVTAKLITELQDEVVISHKDSEVTVGCDAPNGRDMDHKSETEGRQSEDEGQWQGLERLNGRQMGEEQEQGHEEERKMSAQEFMEEEVRKLSVQEAGEPRFLPKKSIQEVEQQPYVRKKSAVEVEVEAPYYRKESMAKTSSADYRKESKTSTTDYRKESRQLEELKHLSDNQYFTKQALNNATSTTINQV